MSRESARDTGVPTRSERLIDAVRSVGAGPPDDPRRLAGWLLAGALLILGGIAFLAWAIVTGI